MKHPIHLRAAELLRHMRFAKPRIDTTPYEHSHGKPPRGRGRWAFCPKNKAYANDYLAYTVFSPDLNYADAVKWAIKHPKLQNEFVIAVLP